jgi:hypothetical protein
MFFATYQTKIYCQNELYQKMLPSEKIIGWVDLVKINKNKTMKKIVSIAIFTILSTVLLAQADTDPIVQAFKTANIDNIAVHFDEFIDLKLLDKEEVKNMSKNQASIALKAFYTENGIKGFEKVSDGGKGTLIYLIGKLTTGNKSFNATIQMKQKNGKPAIITIRIN